MWRCAGLVVVTGCSALLGIHDFHQGEPDGGPDVDAVDAIPPHDEDHDGFDDTIDFCPHLANAPGSNPDRDGDGVGDACDPHPDAPGDHIAEFVTFASSTGNYSFTGTSPTLQDDQLVVDSTTGQIVATEPGMLATDILELGVTLGPAASGPRQVAIVAASKVNLAALYFCQLYGADATSTSFGFTYTTDGSNYTNNTVAAMSPLENGSARLALDHKGSTLDCRTTWPAAQQTVADNPVPFATDVYGFALQGLHARIDWVIRIHTD